jgi:non-ribosomal peptide synthetase component E (peptide arylation enzyme)
MQCVFHSQSFATQYQVKKIFSFANALMKTFNAQNRIAVLETFPSDNLQQFLRSAKIKSFAIPGEFGFVEALPKTSPGKIDKKTIRAFI